MGLPKTKIGDVEITRVNHLPAKAGGLLKTDTQQLPAFARTGLVDQPEHLKCYVTGECIDTVGCSSSPTLCGK